ncbi:DKNYY domain-containing protein [Sagittula sp. S175]|uniref:DKNYY domain-containing protein n=1 Tax=Sagittula sp. S175 TaxID=3415129 RepID=UPI003C7AE115
MGYEVAESAVRWKGKAVKGADAASFVVLSDSLARDARTVWMSGRAVKADAASFEVLSETYARDRDAVYCIMASKLKPLPRADSASFEAVGAQFGRDAGQAFFRDKGLRLSKGGALARLRSLGHVYATDGAVLFFTTKAVQPPVADVDWALAGLKWLEEDGYDINLPPLILGDGARVWFHSGIGTGAGEWAALEGASFEAVEPVPGVPPGDAAFLRDEAQVWFRDGTRFDGADPRQVTQLGSVMLRQCDRMWVGARALDLEPDKVRWIMAHGTGSPEYYRGDLVHLGDRVAVLDPSKGMLEIARAQPEAGTLDEIAGLALRPLLARLVTALQRFLPIITAPGDMAEPLAGDLAEVPGFDLRIEGREVVLALGDGTVLRQPVTCWYTLGCHLWCHMHGLEAQVVPFTAAGIVLPRGTEMAHMLLHPVRLEMWRLAAALFRGGVGAGAKDEAHLLAHDLLFRETGPHALARHPELVAALAGLPGALAEEVRFRPPRHGFDVTTNLAVARLILRDGWLEAEDPRDRLDVAGVLHGALIATDKRAVFLTEILPAVMARFAVEPVAMVREHLGFVLEAACIGGQVDLEVSRICHGAPLLEVIDFCRTHGLHTRFNDARRVEVLWSMDRVAEGDAAAEALVARYGDAVAWPGVYAHRIGWRTTRLWLLGARTRVNWRPSGCADRAEGLAVHGARLEAMGTTLAALMAEYGPQAEAWDEVVYLREEMARYAAALEAS